MLILSLLVDPPKNDGVNTENKSMQLQWTTIIHVTGAGNQVEQDVACWEYGKREDCRTIGIQK